MNTSTNSAVHVSVAAGTLIRRPQKTSGYSVAYLLIFLAMSAVGTFTPLHHESRALAVLILSLIGSPSLFLAWRWYRAGLCVSANGILVRGQFRDRKLSLEEVGSFESRTIGVSGLAAPYGIVARRTNGRLVPVDGLTKTRGFGESEIAKACEEWKPTVEALNELLKGLKGDALMPSAPITVSRRDAHRATMAYAASSGAALAILLLAALVSRDRTLPLVLAVVYVPIAVGSTLYVHRRVSNRVGIPDDP